jgi:hypothetical protein
MVMDSRSSILSLVLRSVILQKSYVLLPILRRRTIEILMFKIVLLASPINLTHKFTNKKKQWASV